MAVLRESGSDNLDNGVKRKGADPSKKRKAGGGVSLLFSCIPLHSLAAGLLFLLETLAQHLEMYTIRP